jgi:hypothetical protein
MVTIEFCRPTWDGDDVAVVAVLTVKGRDAKVEGAMAGVIDLTMPVMSLNHARSLRFDEDPEEWARSLPGSYRAPDLFARVVADDNPVEDEQAEPIVIKDVVHH